MKQYLDHNSGKIGDIAIPCEVKMEGTSS
jgi:hypothetical protein